jgi:hypothetical protein
MTFLPAILLILITIIGLSIMLKTFIKTEKLIRELEKLIGEEENESKS